MSGERDAEFIGNTLLNHLYSHEWKSGKGKFLNVVFAENEPVSVDVILEPNARNRVKLTIAFVRDRGDIKSIELRKFKEYKHRGWQPYDDGMGHEFIKVSPTTFANLLNVIELLSKLDIDALNQRRLPLTIDQLGALDDQTAKTIRSLLSRSGGADLIEELLRHEDLIGRDLVNVAYRKDQLRLFQSMLGDSSLDESDWQGFFQSNEWIFGHGLDYQFRGILQSQPHLSETGITGKGAVIGDFLLADRRFTAFVELKTPLTPLFAANLNRSQVWQLSRPLMGSLSQILQQRASGQHRLERGELFDAGGRRIQQKAFDPKVFLIIGSWAQLAGVSDEERAVKERTLELFRRDSRNVEVILFDELYDRASYIVEGPEKVGTSAD